MIWQISLMFCFLATVCQVANSSCFTPAELQEIWSHTGVPPRRNGLWKLDTSVIVARSLVTQVAQIILTEVMGFEVAVHSLSSEEEYFALERVAAGVADVNFQVFTGYGVALDANYEKYVIQLEQVADMRSSGMQGRMGWWFPSYLKSTSLEDSNDFSFWKHLIKNTTIDFLVANAIAVNSSLFAAPPFVPEWCSTPGAKCAQIIASDAFVKHERSAKIILGLNLHLMIVFVDATNLDSIIASSEASMKPFILLDYEPGTRNVGGSVQRILLPEYDSTCYSMQQPLLTCDFPVLPLNKFVSVGSFGKEAGPLINGREQLGSLSDDQHDFLGFVEDFQFHNFEVEKLMQSLMNGSESTYNVTCEWLKNGTSSFNSASWPQWAANSPEAFHIDPTVALEVIVLVVVFFSITFLLMLGICGLRKRYKLANKSFNHSIIFDQILLFGIVLWCGCIFVSSSLSSSLGCQSVYTLESMAFHFVWTNLVLRSYHTYTIFKADLSNIPSVRRLSGCLIGALLLDLLLLYLYFSFDYPVVVDTIAAVSPCVFKYPVFFLAVRLFVKTVMVLLGLFFGFHTRKISIHHSESKAIALAFFLLIFFLLVRTLIYLVASKEDPSTSFLLTSVFILITLLIPVVLMASKLFYSFGNAQNAFVHSKALLHADTNYAINSSSASESQEEMKTKRRFASPSSVTSSLGAGLTEDFPIER